MVTSERARIDGWEPAEVRAQPSIHMPCEGAWTVYCAHVVERGRAAITAGQAGVQGDARPVPAGRLSGSALVTLEQAGRALLRAETLAEVAAIATSSAVGIVDRQQAARAVLLDASGRPLGEAPSPTRARPPGVGGLAASHPHLYPVRAGTR